MRVVDTFSGLGGFRKAAQNACSALGIEFSCVKSVEVDKNACKTYEANFGENPLGDMRAIPPEDFPDHDLLLGGFPCQPFSRNGRIYNFSNKTIEEDDRSNLCTRLLSVLATKKPKCFVFENVKGLLGIKNADGSSFFDTLYDNLVSAGYAVSAIPLNTYDFGLPQQRKRVYFVGLRNDLLSKHELPMPMSGMDRIPAVEDVLDKEVPEKYLLQNLWHKRTNLRTVAQIVDHLTERGIEKPKFVVSLLRLGPASINKRLSRYETLKIAYESGTWERPSERTGEITPIAIIYGETISGAPRQQDKLYSIKGISPTIATFSTPAFDSAQGWRVLTPRECARLQGFPDDFKLPMNDALAYKQVGNAVSVKVAQAVVQSVLCLMDLPPV